MEREKIYNKFGDYYAADEHTYKMGIDQRITKIIAERFKNKNVLETCTGGGFTTIALARTANKVTSIEINKETQNQAIANASYTGLSEKVNFILGDSIDKKLLASIMNIDSAFLDPDWADTGSNHIFKFKDSNTKPPADKLLETTMKITPNIALILPPFIEEKEFKDLLPHEFQKIYLGNDIVLFCLYFGNLSNRTGESKMIVET